MRLVLLAILTVFGLGILGCNERTEYSQEEKRTLEHNLTRSLTPEEAGRLGGGPGGNDPGPAAGDPESG